MGATVQLGELTFADPFDLYQAAPPGTKLAAEADAIIVALAQILAELRKMKKEQPRGLDEDETPDFAYLANNILQLATMLGNVKWGEEGGIERVRIALEVQLKMLGKMLADLKKNGGNDPRTRSMIAYLERVLRIGKQATKSWAEYYANARNPGRK